jgi:hypothetical protein
LKRGAVLKVHVVVAFVKYPDGPAIEFLSVDGPDYRFVIRCGIGRCGIGDSEKCGHVRRSCPVEEPSGCVVVSHKSEPLQGFAFFGYGYVVMGAPLEDA